MKIYTKTGDDGTTGLFGGARVEKNHPRVEACGAVDELNAALGMTLGHRLQESILVILNKAQHDLFAIGADLATPTEQAHRLAERSAGVSEGDVQALEQAIDQHEAALPPLQQFILPGGSGAAATLHLARAVCRRAERRVIDLQQVDPVRPEILIYLNRLSDLLFVLARASNHHLGIADTPWRPAVR